MEPPKAADPELRPRAARRAGPSPRRLRREHRGPGWAASPGQVRTQLGSSRAGPGRAVPGNPHTGHPGPSPARAGLLRPSPPPSAEQSEGRPARAGRPAGSGQRQRSRREPPRQPPQLSPAERAPRPGSPHPAPQRPPPAAPAPRGRPLLPSGRRGTAGLRPPPGAERGGAHGPPPGAAPALRPPPRAAAVRSARPRGAPGALLPGESPRLPWLLLLPGPRPRPARPRCSRLLPPLRPVRILRVPCGNNKPKSYSSELARLVVVQLSAPNGAVLALVLLMVQSPLPWLF